jgi:hypothetical protein
VSLSLSPHVRLIALVGLALAVAMAGAMFALGRTAEEPEPVTAAGPLPSLATPPAPPADVAPSAAEQAAPAAEASAAAAAPVEPAPEPAPEPATAAKPEPPPIVAENGLPWPVHTALQRHEVVVVALFTPGARVDRLALDEARTGAKRANAGFVALDALDERHGGPLARLVGVVSSPNVLVYQHPDRLFVRFEGFADVETIAQAAVNARR